MRLTFFLALLLIVGCSKETKYAYYDNTPPVRVDDRIYPLEMLQMEKNIDILFVIDNSASMAPIQDNVINNARIFLEQFAQKSYINWKIGLVSTDEREAPYLGFDQPFDWRLIDPKNPASFENTIVQFQKAVGKLGTDGSPYEYVFYNVHRALKSYPSFLRSNSHLVVIMISDEDEQSLSMGPLYNPIPFYNAISQFVSMNKITRFYGALSRTDLKDCQSTVPGDEGTYAGSAYEKIINLSGGFNISACTQDFGVELAKVGKDIASLVGLSSLLLKERPIVSSIKVFYKGKLLPSGPPETGGLWYYQEKNNTVNFYKLDFIDDNDAKNFFKIEFDIDDGYQRH